MKRMIIASSEDINEVDIEMYRPSENIIQKLMDYRAKGSRVNTKAIKDLNKLLTYYYGAKLIGWGDLAYDIKAVIPYNYRDVLDKINIFVHADDAYSDKRSSDDISLNIGDSKNLFTFDQRRGNGKVSCWLPKSFMQYLIDHNIPAHFGRRTPASYYDRNGRQWSEMEHITLFPDTEAAFDYEVVVHTNEGGGSNTYTAPNTEERISAKRLIEALDSVLRRRGLV